MPLIAAAILYCELLTEASEIRIGTMHVTTKIPLLAFLSILFCLGLHVAIPDLAITMTEETIKILVDGCIAWTHVFYCNDVLVAEPKTKK